MKELEIIKSIETQIVIDDLSSRFEYYCFEIRK